MVRALLIAAALHTLTVPLDHTGATPGTLKLAYTRVPATGTRTGALVFLAGGPGQEAIPFTALFSRLLEDVRSNYDLVFLDQRGTGRSQATSCAFADLAACGDRLGVRRPFMTTTETAADLEDLRVALGAQKLTPLGISYGTQVADAYARRFPDHTAALILDSPASNRDTDPFDRVPVAVLPRVLAGVCGGACRRTVGDVERVYRRAVARVRRGPVDRVSEALVLDALRIADVQPLVRAELPAALASLARGDGAPLRHALLLWPEEPSLGAISDARLYATECVERALPWAPDAPVAGRAAATEAALAALGREPYAPFSTGVAYRFSIVPDCEEWPPTPQPAPLPAVVPQVPVLVISGRDDVRTPLESARRIAAGYPHATLLAIPHVGHSDLRTDPSGCARRGAVAFLRGRPVRPCGRTRPFMPPAPYRPPNLRGRRAVAATIAASWRDRAAATRVYGLGRRERLPALRSGFIVVSKAGLDLHAAETERGVRVSGTLDRRGRGTVRAGGRAYHF